MKLIYEEQQRANSLKNRVSHYVTRVLVKDDEDMDLDLLEILQSFSQKVEDLYKKYIL